MSSPALVSQQGARRLPRLALLLLCVAYVLPGNFDRDPWRNADLASYGLMVAMAEGRTPWLAPTLGGVAADTAPLPHALGALSIRLLAPWFTSDFAARVPFALLLALVLALVWYTTFHLARTEAAQPVPFAFGGEADPVAYARAMADGALLALIATLGLLQLGHETTPELAQLAGVALLLYALAASPFRSWQPRVAVLLALSVLAASGAPWIACAAGLGGAVICARSQYAEVRRFAAWVLAAVVLAAGIAAALGSWRLRAVVPTAADLLSIARQWVWFLWPAWLLVLWTLWRWREHLARRHMTVPLVTVVVAMAANLAMAGSDRALMLALPGMAVLASFALPTLRRSATAAVDWFSMFFFSLAAVFLWVIYIAMHTGVPAKPAANVAKLAPGFATVFSWPELVAALLATVAWVWLVRWRTGRHRQALWKSLVLPAGGVALCWLLLMTLWLPLLNYARSSGPLVERIRQHVPADACIAAPGASPALVAALEAVGGWRVDARPASAGADCEMLILVSRRAAPPAPPGWTRFAEVQRPTERDEITAIFRRGGP